MRFAAVSILAIFATIPAFADVRLPVVNVAAGSVSARAAFGENLVEVKPLQKPLQIESKKVAQVKPVSKSISIDSGEKILANRGDVLSPRKPSGDLWVRNDSPLRLPQPQEFVSLDNDFSQLPEEDLQPKVIARASAIQEPVVESKSGELDAQIAKLVDLQRKADASVRTARINKPVDIISYDMKSPRVVERESRPVSVKSYNQDSDDVSLSRVVVPMDDDVVVRKVKKDAQPSFASIDGDFSKMSPGELKKAFKKTYLSENKHLSTYKIDDRFDVASDLSTSAEGFTAEQDLSESGGVRPLEIKIGFKGEDSSLSRDNYNLLSEYASIVVSNPKRAIQVSIPERSTRSLDDRKLAARRLAIVEQVLRDTGVSDQRIMPVLSQRSDDGFVLRVISSDQYETLTQQKRDMFGDSVSNKTYKSMTW